MRISDWSSDVCSSDLLRIDAAAQEADAHRRDRREDGERHEHLDQSEAALVLHRDGRMIVSAACPRPLSGRTSRSMRSKASSAVLATRCSTRSEEHTSELQSLMRISYAVFCLKKKNDHNT